MQLKLEDCLLQNFLLLRVCQSFVILRISSDWVMSIHITEITLLHSKPIDLNVNPNI